MELLRVELPWQPMITSTAISLDGAGGELEEVSPTNIKTTTMNFHDNSALLQVQGRTNWSLRNGFIKTNNFYMFTDQIL